MTNRLVQHIAMEESTSIQWLNNYRNSHYNGTDWSCSAVMHPQELDGISNSVALEQTPPGFALFAQTCHVLIL